MRLVVETSIIVARSGMFWYHGPKVDSPPTMGLDELEAGGGRERENTFILVFLELDVDIANDKWALAVAKNEGTGTGRVRSCEPNTYIV